MVTRWNKGAKKEFRPVSKSPRRVRMDPRRDAGSEAAIRASGLARDASRLAGDVLPLQRRAP
jgi:hypothetical protein